MSGTLEKSFNIERYNAYSNGPRAGFTEFENREADAMDKIISQQIASTLKKLRQINSLSLNQVAQLTGVSKAMLGQIEREESSPTMAVLWKIAQGLHVSMAIFMPQDPIKTKISRSLNQVKLYTNNKKIHITPLFPYDAHLNCEVYAIDLLPQAEFKFATRAVGIVEHVMVVAGQMEVYVDDDWHVLRKGEGMRFSAHQSHGFRNVSISVSRFHNILHYPANFALKSKTVSIVND